MISLVGYTGFVGSNIYNQQDFDAVYNSKNIEESYDTKPDLLIYSGMRAEKYLANKDPERDYGLVVQAEENISRINPKKLVLISTIDVFKRPKDVDENSVIDTDGLPAYGYNRFLLEKWVRENYPDALIVRLPGLYGKNIKKNFIYDFINFIPFMLKKEKFDELIVSDPDIRNYYELQDNGFYKYSADDSARNVVRTKFEHLGFSALSFTDSRSKFQFYNLNNLWNDIKCALCNGIELWHPATEPVSAGELYSYITGKDFINEINDQPADYDYKTVYSEVFGGHDGYICSKGEVMRDIKNFIDLYKR